MRLERRGAQVDAAERDAALVGVVEPDEQLGERGLARARRADEREVLALGDGERDAGDGRRLAVVREGHAGGCELARRGERLGAAGDARRLGEQGGDLRECRTARLELACTSRRAGRSDRTTRSGRGRTRRSSRPRPSRSARGSRRRRAPRPAPATARTRSWGRSRCSRARSAATRRPAPASARGTRRSGRSRADTTAATRTPVRPSCSSDIVSATRSRSARKAGRERFP